MKRSMKVLVVLLVWAMASWLTPVWLSGWLLMIGLCVGSVVLFSRLDLPRGPKALVAWLLVGFGFIPLLMAFVFTVAPDSFEWFHERLMLVRADVQRLATTPALTTAAMWVFAAFVYPGVQVVVWVWNDLLGLKAEPFDKMQVWSYPLLVFVLVFSWIVWSVLISRSLKFVGLWDPFWRAETAGRRWVLDGWVRLAGWWAEGRFGYGPGSAWANLVEVLSLRFVTGDIFLGRPKLRIGGLLRPIGFPTEKHVVTIAAPGSGKSTGALVPNLCLHEGALLCVDPKGELAAITVRRRGAGGNGVRGLGQKVCVVDPFKIVEGWESASYNVFDELARVAERDPDRVVSYASELTEALVLEVSGKEPYWDLAAKGLLKALILYVFAFEPKERRNLLRMRELLVQGDVEAHREQKAAGNLDIDDTPFTVLLEKMTLCRPHPLYGHVIAGEAEDLKRLPPGGFGSVITTAKTHTEFLDQTEFRSISTRSDFLLEDFRTQKLSVYLCLPASRMHGIEGRWLRMFVVLFTDMMESPGIPPKPPVLLAIDEFPSLGRLKGIESVAPRLRSYGVRFWAIAQDISQLKAVYPDAWDGFIGGADAVQFMGITHPATVDFIVQRLGVHVVYDRIRGPDGRFRRAPRTAPLLDADQVGLLLASRKKNQIVWRGNNRHLLLKITPYFEYMPGWYYDSDQRFPERLRHRIWRWLRRIWHGRSGGGGSTNAVAAPPAGAPAVSTAVPPTPPETESDREQRWVDVVAENEERKTDAGDAAPPKVK